MKEKLYVCVLSACRAGEFGSTVVSTGTLICVAASKEEATGKAIISAESSWPRANNFYDHAVSAEEFSDWTISEVYRLYPLDEAQS